MTTLTLKDGTEFFYKDWGTGQPVVFSHGWPLDGDAWDAQMLFLGQKGYRVIAHDRRGHGRSGQTWEGNDMDTYADDLAQLFEHLDLKDVIMIGHSTGGGEVARYIGRHGTSRVAKTVLIGAVPPIMLKTAANPEGLPIDVFDGIRAGFTADRSQFFKDLALPFFGFNREGAKVSQGAIDSFWSIGMLGSVKGEYDCIKAFSETDFTEDLKKLDVPTLILHGDDDQIVPIVAAGYKSHELVTGSKLHVVKGGAHGMCTVQPAEINEILLDFLKG
ncbi:MAG TPA: alpha/beta hydrolase [Pseudomonas sp.]|uniref:alpha/beta fold hydrolase n=1 Tax=Pseudomonas sp. TaxID=306 RepID=UPI002ED896D8